MLSRFVLHASLAFALLSAQSAGLAHAATHLGKEPAKQEQNLLHLKLCDKCVSFAKLSCGPPSQAIIMVGDTVRWAPLRASSQSVETCCTTPYQSRAPPPLL